MKGKRLGALSRAMIDAALPLSTVESEAVAKETHRRYVLDVLGYAASGDGEERSRPRAPKEN